MKRLIFASLFLLSFLTQAQTIIRDDFDSNSLGWNEFAGKKYSAIIQDGVLHLETREGAPTAIASCYSIIDPQKSFEIKMGLVKTKIDDEERGIGIVLNYLDDYNFDVFYMSKEKAFYKRFVEGKLFGFRCGDVKIDKKLRDHELIVKSAFDKLEFFINNVKALEIQHAPLLYPGFGVSVWADDGKQVADVDYIEFKQ